MFTSGCLILIFASFIYNNQDSSIFDQTILVMTDNPHVSEIFDLN